MTVSFKQEPENLPSQASCVLTGDFQRTAGSAGLSITATDDGNMARPGETGLEAAADDLMLLEVISRRKRIRPHRPPQLLEDREEASLRF